MKVNDFKSNKDIEHLLQSLLENRLNNVVDINVEQTIRLKRDEVARYLDLHFDINSYTLQQRCHLYALILSLFAGKIESVRPLILKLNALEIDEEAKKFLTRILTVKVKKRGKK